MPDELFEVYFDELSTFRDAVEERNSRCDRVAPLEIPPKRGKQHSLADTDAVKRRGTAGGGRGRGRGMDIYTYSFYLFTGLPVPNKPYGFCGR